MFAVIFLISIWIFIRTLTYGIYEIKQNSNTIGGVTAIVCAILSLILPNFIIYFTGFYQ